MRKHTRRSLTAVTLAVALCGAGGTAMAATGNQRANAADDAIAARNERLINQFVEKHPDDYAGLDDLTRKLTGKHIEVQFAGVEGTFTGVEAQTLIDEQNSTETVVGIQPFGSLPADAFTVSISRIPLSTWNAQVRGSWNFRDNFIGGDRNADFASLGFKVPSCVNIEGHSSSTYLWNGTATSSSSLRSANSGGASPIWNIYDKISNFERSNDHGFVWVRLRNGCGKVQYNNQADFTYEANNGAAAVSVGASFGLISASYSGGVSTLQKGTAPITFAS